MPLDVDKLSLRFLRDVEPTVYASFESGRTSLDEFLKEDAHAYDQHGLTTTVLAFHDDHECPVAYFSLSTDSVKLSGVELTDLGLPFSTPIKFFPAVKLTKLAVLHRLQNDGLGSYLIDLICGLVSDTPFAVRLITVDAINHDDVIGFYAKVGFIESLNHSPERVGMASRETLLMYKDLYQ